MSAFVVSREHIRFLVGAAISQRIAPGHQFSYYHDGTQRVIRYENADKAGQMLWDENLASVRYRYDNPNPDELPGPVGEDYIFAFRSSLATNYDPVHVIKACHCLEYQSCEHEWWDASEAKAFVDALRRSASHVLDGYDDAPWERVA